MARSRSCCRRNWNRSVVTATHAQREHIAAVTDWLYEHRAQLDYPPHDVRGPLDAHSWHLTEQQARHVLSDGGRLMFDCSELYSWVLKCAGLWPLNYPGFTGTDLTLLPHYTDARAAGIGAGAVFGPGTGEHVSWVKHPDHEHGNPIMCSHGRPGLDYVHLQDEARAHAAPITMLSIAHL